MDGSVSAIATMGLGNYAGVGFLPTLGYGTGRFGPVEFVSFQADGSGVYSVEVQSGLAAELVQINSYSFSSATVLTSCIDSADASSTDIDQEEAVTSHIFGG